MPISCHFRDCKALLVTSLTHVSGAIASVQTFTFTQVTKEVVQLAHDIGLFVRVCISDMGPSNRNMWKTVGVFSRKNSTSSNIQHPCASSATDRLYFVADTPHLLKN